MRRTSKTKDIAIANKAVVELVGFGKQLAFTVIESDSQELPVGSSFDSPAHLWNTAFQGAHKRVACEIKSGHIFFVGKFKCFPLGGSYVGYWRPSL